MHYIILTGASISDRLFGTAGSEWGVLLDPAFVFPSVGQLLLEVHLGSDYLEYCPLHTAEVCPSEPSKPFAPRSVASTLKRYW